MGRSRTPIAPMGREEEEEDHRDDDEYEDE